MRGAPPEASPTLTEDDLFRPTVASTARDPGLPPPWRVESQIWVAFFGGCFAALAIAWLNLRRLGVDTRALAPRMTAASAAAFLVVVGVAAVVVTSGGLSSSTGRAFRWGLRGAALLLYVGFARLQKAPMRRWLAQHDEAGLASLWRPGLLVACGGALFEALLAAVLLLPFALATEAP